jgi:hypothetical protein
MHDFTVYVSSGCTSLQSEQYQISMIRGGSTAVRGRKITFNTHYLKSMYPDCMIPVNFNALYILAY